MDPSFFDTNILMIAVITGAFGTGYFIYGKKQQMAVPMVSGIILCIYPYFTTNLWILCGVGIFFIGLPYFLRF